RARRGRRRVPVRAGPAGARAQHPPLPERNLMAAVEAPVLQESVAAKILRVLGKTPVHLFLAAVGLLWLVPTIGLLVTSILPASNFDAQGWWKVFSKPSLATWSNYDEIFKNHQITHALVTTLEIAVGGTVLPI